MARTREASGPAGKRSEREREPSPGGPHRCLAGAAPPPSVTITVPLNLRRRGGRKVILAPVGTPQWNPAQHSVNDSVVKALARAFRWKQMIESGSYGSITELAAAEKINDSYVCRTLRLTLLAPDVVELLLDRRLPDLTLYKLMKPFPALWRSQTAAFRL